MRKKGISPLIATVLLIGFTIVIAALVIKWGGDLVRSQAKTTTCTSQAQLKCVSPDVEIDLLIRNETDINLGDAINTDNNITVSLTAGAYEIGGLVITGYDKNGETSKYYHLTDGEKSFPIEVKNIDIGAFSSYKYVIHFGNGQTGYNLLEKTVDIMVIPKIKVTDNEGETCWNDCTDKKVTASTDYKTRIVGA